MRKCAAAILCLSAFLVTGCFDIEQTLTLERNLSGQAGFSMKVDMEPMVVFMTQMQREMEGKKGPPTEAELAKARKERQSSSKSSTPADFEKEKKEMASKLPKGVTLVDAKFQDEGLKMTALATFAFDNASKLAQIELPDKSGPGGGGPGGPPNPAETPFGGLQVTDEGKTILVTSPVKNPAADTQAPGAAPDPAMMKQIEGMFKGLRVAFKITAPFDIVEHNAHRKEGNTLVWEYNMASIQKLTPDQLKQGIKVRYRK
jgi:hypothetical protein